MISEYIYQGATVYRKNITWSVFPGILVKYGMEWVIKFTLITHVPMICRLSLVLGTVTVRGGFHTGRCESERNTD